MELAFGARGHWFESCPDFIFLPCIYSFVSLLRTLFVRWGLVRDWSLRNNPILRPKKWTFRIIGFPSSINDDFKRECVTGDHSFKHGCFSIKIQYLTTALGRIFFSSVVMVLAFGARGHWFESCPDLIFLSRIVICFFFTDFVRKTW